MTSTMLFQPLRVLGTSGGGRAKNFPISLSVYSASSDLSELFKLRYRAFLHSGWIRENRLGMLSDRYDTLDSTIAVAAFHNGECIGSLRLAFSEADAQRPSMPSEEQFPSEILALRAEGCPRLVEYSRLAIEPTLTNNSFRTTLYASLVRAGIILTTASNIDAALIAVHKKISPFYQAMCGFKVLGKCDSYAGIPEPTHFLGLKVAAAEARRRQRNAFFAFSPEELETAIGALAKIRHQTAA